MRNTKAQSTTKDAARIYAERHAEVQSLLERIPAPVREGQDLRLTAAP